MAIYVLNQRINNKKHNATGKAMSDVFSILNKCHVKVVPGIPKNWHKIFKIIDIFILGVYCLCVFGKNDYCIFIYSDNAMKIRLLDKLKRFKNYTTVCLINDVNSIRSDGLYSQSQKAEIDRDFELIGSADIVLAPNKGSIEYMKNRGTSAKLIPVSVWDYLMDDDMAVTCDRYAYECCRGILEDFGSVNELENGDTVTIRHDLPRWRIGFAGNLSKSGFLKEINELSFTNTQYHLWGEGMDEEMINNDVIYHNSVAPDKLPIELAKNCHFGLVWDGESIHQIKGGYGEYLRFNNSHKCGCYLAAGIPVIVWKESGMAYFVKENNCGIVIGSLDELSSVLMTMSVDEYKKLITSTRKVSEKVRNGFYLNKALDLAILNS